MKSFKERISFSSKNRAKKKKKVLCTFYFRTTVTHGTHSIPKVMSGFAFI